MAALVPLSSTSPDKHHRYPFGLSDTLTLPRRQWNARLPRNLVGFSPLVSFFRHFSRRSSSDQPPIWWAAAVPQGIAGATTESERVGASEVGEAFGVTETGRFSVSDETFLERGFKFRNSLEGIDLDQLNELFVKVGFPRRHKQKLELALKHTSSICWLEEVKSSKLIAFARATGDDVFNAIIWDVVVDPSYQGLGLGKAIMERLMVDLLNKGIMNIGLYAEPNVVGFYKPLGYIADPQGIRAMAYSKKGR
ncbi:hypothetical protein KP509_18G064900 [Ceratopteris richardii]|uniref:N-acetyltransferase domain-containing protein n=1 Tax=Ceratopteris richardii TaxID=49495 RepID=A0A8T2SU43_CERRI|nr:hypothetical protein KP509_18G064900 [Ceratopteris richardii]